MVDMMTAYGLQDGMLVRIAHCFNAPGAQALMDAVKSQHPNCRFIIEPTTALCSFYAEVGGLIVGYEGNFCDYNDNSKF